MSKAKEAFISILLDHMIIFFIVLIYLERELEFLIYSILIFLSPHKQKDSFAVCHPLSEKQ